MLLALFIAYLLGSIPCGLLLTRAAGLGDIRTMGSGNIGATNVLRSGGKKLGILTLLLDMGKGALAVWIALKILEQYPAADLNAIAFAPLAAVAGHVFPVWLGFKGGKGVATAIGAIFITFMPVYAMGLSIMAVWLTAFLATRYASVASIACFWIGPVIALLIGDTQDLIDPAFTMTVILPIAALITYRHKDNIRRLRAGTESRFGKKGVSL